MELPQTQTRPSKRKTVNSNHVAGTGCVRRRLLREQKARGRWATTFIPQLGVEQTVLSLVLNGLRTYSPIRGGIYKRKNVRSSNFFLVDSVAEILFSYIFLCFLSFFLKSDFFLVESSFSFLFSNLSFINSNLRSRFLPLSHVMATLEYLPNPFLTT